MLLLLLLPLAPHYAAHVQIQTATYNCLHTFLQPFDTV
jgi:hypothetical protein